MRHKKIASFVLAAILSASFITSANAEEKSYTVQSGDTLWKIASTNHVTVSDLKTWNNLTTDTIYIGQSLKLSGNTTPLESTTQQTANYTVKAADSLSLIAKNFTTTVTSIKTLNNLTSDTIYIGQTLKIPSTIIPQTTEPSSVQTATIYKVVSGDTLSAIGKKYNITVDQIKQWNGLTSDLIYVGQELKVSNGEVSKPIAPSFLADGMFPLAKGTYSPFGDTWGDARTQGRTHEGTDIMAPTGTPIYSATDGVIVNYGWNELGGWRISIKTNDSYNLYYAHMSKYAPNLAIGVHVTKGQVIGYVGNSGYGPEGTTGQFVSHLHFGMYNSSWVAMNPYNHLKYWESKN